MGLADSIAAFISRHLTWVRALIFFGAIGAIVLALPASVASAVRLDEWRQTYGWIAGLVVIAGLVGLAIEGVAALGRAARSSVGKRIATGWTAKQLTRDEWEVLEDPLESGSLTFIEEAGDAVTWGLCRKGLLICNGRYLDPMLSGSWESWSIQLDVWPTLEAQWKARKSKQRTQRRKRLARSASRKEPDGG